MIPNIKEYFWVNDILEFLDKYATEKEFIEFKQSIINSIKNEHGVDVSNLLHMNIYDFVSELDKKYNIDIYSIIDSDDIEIENILKKREDYYIIHYDADSSGFDIYEIDF